MNTDLLERQKKENMVLTSGRIGLYVKNNQLLVDAIQKIPRDVVDIWKFYFVGPYTDEFYPYVKSVKSLKPYLADKIILTGNIMDRNQLYSYYQRAKIICMTSRTEGAGIARLEAMYFGAYYEKCGTIVSSDANALAEALAKKCRIRN